MGFYIGGEDLLPSNIEERGYRALTRDVASELDAPQDRVSDWFLQSNFQQPSPQFLKM